MDLDCSVKVISSNIDPKKFFDEFIQSRSPVVFQDQNVGKSGSSLNLLWTNPYFYAKCGSENVRVEYKTDSTERFGEGKEKIMPFSTFLSEMEAGNEDLYLTTQELEYDDDGRPAIVSPPVTQLLPDIEFTPTLFSTLIVANINLWFGSSSRYISSGLHHDYHDNLYVLLRGSKKITLYSPAYAEKMYTVGEISRVHPNGRINYVGQETLADGSNVHAEAALQASLKLDYLAKKLDQEAKSASTSAEIADNECAEDTEEQIESALKALLDAEVAGTDPYDDDEDDDGGGDVDGDDSSNSNENVEKDGIDGENMSSEVRMGKKRASNEGMGNTDSNANAEGSTKKPRLKADMKKPSKPSNFSRVDTSLSHDRLKELFPLFLECRGTEVTLTAGQMLYIPCGWFHEVLSLGPASSGGHLALNYWFHPPDGDRFEKPYKSDFWATDMKARRSASIH